MSHEMHHFSMGLWVPFLAYAGSVLGSLLGLICARRATTATDRSLQSRWAWCATLSIGGVAIWLTHFIGMMGFDIPGTAVRHDLGLTLISVLLSVGATGFGLWVVRSGGSESWWVLRLIGAGTVMGLAVTGMHYTGMRAMRIRGSIEHEVGYVIASIVIGIVAATAALWFSRVANRWFLQVPAALVMGLAVVSLHYTGMAGVRVHLDETLAAPIGTPATALLLPAFGLGMLVLGAAAVALLATPSPADVALDAQIARWASQVSDAPDSRDAHDAVATG